MSARYGGGMKQTPVFSGATSHANLKDYDSSKNHVLVFFRWQDIFHWLLYNLESKQIVKEGNADRSHVFLDLLKCGEAESKAYVSAQEVESAAVEATHAWLSAPQRQDEQRENEKDEQSPLLRICAVYLKSKSTRETSLADIIKEPSSSET
jgi:hypothetical protein